MFVHTCPPLHIANCQMKDSADGIKAPSTLISVCDKLEEEKEREKWDQDKEL